MNSHPRFRSVVLDSTAPRRLAEFYRQLLGYEYRLGDEPPPSGVVDGAGQDWLVLEKPGAPRLAFQHVDELPRSSWPGVEVPQQLHLDLTVPTAAELAVQRDHALALGARLLLDRSHDPAEPLYVFADPDGHPFCIFVWPG
jgi:catechol 2,3-dioxygenase-like lactoylglutathione lyase family enzyme